MAGEAKCQERKEREVNIDMGLYRSLCQRKASAWIRLASLALSAFLLSQLNGIAIFDINSTQRFAGTGKRDGLS